MWLAPNVLSVSNTVTLAVGCRCGWVEGSSSRLGPRGVGSRTTVVVFASLVSTHGQTGHSSLARVGRTS